MLYEYEAAADCAPGTSCCRAGLDGADIATYITAVTTVEDGLDDVTFNGVVDKLNSFKVRSAAL